MMTVRRLLSKFYIGALAIGWVLSISCAISGPTEPLNEAVIKSLLAQKLSAEYRQYEIDDIKFTQGYFINDKSMCAIVSYYNVNAGRNFIANLWLLIYENSWKLKRQIANGGGIEFKIINIGKGIRPALWYTSGASGQGEVEDWGRLLLLRQNNDEILFEYEGYDACGSGLDNAGFDEHKIEFKDIDGDGVLEILDIETKGKCNNKNYERSTKGMQTIKSVYKFNGKKFVKIK